MKYVSAKQLAAKLGVTRERVNQLVHLGLPRASRGRYDLQEAILWYLNYKRSNSGRAKSECSLAELRKERADLVRTQRETADLELAVRRSQLIPITVYRDRMASKISVARQHLLNIPSRFAHELVGLEQSALRLKLREVIHAALKELATGEPQ